MTSWRRAIAIILVIILVAGCLENTSTSEEITIEETVDLDCDGAASEVTAIASVDAVSPGPSNPDVEAAILYRASDGDLQEIERFDFDRGTSREITVTFDDLDVGDTTELAIVVEEDNIFSNERLGMDSTETLKIESSESDQPVADPDLNFEPKVAEPNETVEFNIQDTTEEGCGINIIQWDFTGDGKTNAEGDSVKHKFTKEGYHDVSATIITSAGYEFSRTDTVFVTDEEGEELRHSADPAPQSFIYPQLLIQLVLTVALTTAIILYVRWST